MINLNSFDDGEQGEGPTRAVINWQTVLAGVFITAAIVAMLAHPGLTLLLIAAGVALWAALELWQ